jgi:hypothetical protein
MVDSGPENTEYYSQKVWFVECIECKDDMLSRKQHPDHSRPERHVSGTKPDLPVEL